MDFKKLNIDFSNMNCLIDDHDCKVFAICIDKLCNVNNKFVCPECIFQLHEQHKLVKLKLIQDKMNDVLQSERETLLKEKLKEIQETVQSEIESIKTNILEILHNKLNFLLTEVNDQFYSICKKYGDFDISKLLNRDLKQLNSDELENLTNVINTYYIPYSNQDIISKSPIEELDKYLSNLKIILNECNKSITDYFNNNLLCNFQSGISIPVEWFNKTYLNYGFLYTIQNKTFVIKSSNDGVITVIRAKDKLNHEYNYKIDFLIDSKKGGDIEVGIGKDSVGSSCWLRSQGAYSITNIGIYENGKLTNKDEKLEDGNLISFDILLKNKIGKLYKNGNMIHEFKIDLDEVYIMGAIRKIGNSILINDFKVIK